jgi:hypothetical protein
MCEAVPSCRTLKTTLESVGASVGLLLLSLTLQIDAA